MTAARALDATIRRLGRGDLRVLDAVAPDVFDAPIDRHWATEFLADPRHHLVVAIAGGEVVGFASGVQQLHPDKLPAMFVNEVGVAPSHQRAGLGRRLLDHLLAHARALGCDEAWVATEPDNRAARALYAAAGGTAEQAVVYGFALAGKSLPA